MDLEQLIGWGTLLRDDEVAVRASVRRLVRETCDRVVRIPMFGTVDSLNVSVAAGVVLYEAVRQRRDEAVRQGKRSKTEGSQEKKR